MRLPLPEVRMLFKRHYGASWRFAQQLGVSANFVSCFLRGRSQSNRVLRAAEEFARKLLAAEGVEVAEVKIDLPIVVSTDSRFIPVPQFDAIVLGIDGKRRLPVKLERVS